MRRSRRVWAPTLAFVGAFLLLLAIYWVFQWMTPGLANRSFRLGQLATGTWVGVHARRERRAEDDGRDRARAVRARRSIDTFYIPTWVKIAAGVAIAAGTYAGGWRIMRTLGQRVFQMDPPAGFAAQATAGAVIYASTKYGYPLSTTHVVSGAVMGVGRDEAALGGALGRRRQHRHRLGPDDPGRPQRSRRCCWFPIKAIF